jgi:propionyl-CoA synthetase|tara:strand:+ start:1003 stop:1164 length:162 start_codon:yes stop_codon:yes gene_type:complete
MSYTEEYEKSIQQPESYWDEKAKDLDWFRFPKQILSEDEPSILDEIKQAIASR